jgi:dTDP-glucose 4,6-dehydratase
MKNTKLILLIGLLFQVTFFAFIPMQSEIEHAKVIFITGAAGFIGSNFLKYMFDKYPSYQFLVLDALTYAGSLDNIPQYIQESNRFEFFHGSITDPELVEELTSRANFIVHFAAESDITKSIRNDSLCVATNIMGTQTMLRALVKSAAMVERFIHISSSEVYGTGQDTVIDEDHPLLPRSPYAAAKAGAESLAYAYCCTYDIPAVIVRFFNNYGPQQHIEKVIPRFITNAIQKKPLIIEGSGLQVRDWMHTLDSARALDLILHKDDFISLKHQIINMGSGVGTSIIDIAHMILKHFNLPETYLEFTQDRPGQVEYHCSASQKAHYLLQWKIEIPFTQGLESTIAWYCQNQNWWDDLTIE